MVSFSILFFSSLFLSISFIFFAIWFVREMFETNIEFNNNFVKDSEKKKESVKITRFDWESIGELLIAWIEDTRIYGLQGF